MAAQYYQGTIKGKCDADMGTSGVEKTCQDLKDAMKCFFGTDEKEIIKVLSEHTNTQLQEIKQSYKTMYGKDLEEELKDELSGHFETLCVRRLIPSREFDAFCLHDAMKGLGTNETTLIEILVSHSNSDIKDIKQEYKKMYDEDLEDDLKKETSGDLRCILVSLVQGNRDEDPTVDPKLVENDVNDLKEAGTKIDFGTEESEFNRILSKRSISHLKALFEAYRSDEEKDLETVISDEMSGDTYKAFLALVRCVKDPLEYFASCFHESMDGPGTDDGRLIRLVLSHCEVDLKDIANKYMDMYKKGLALAIKEDTSGDYRKLLLSLVKDD